eukprot:CAMPEP_0116133978 /NCGR_PEP_ID=MMETSP0329-20121206/10401_1 /TAXON_ID=697910 /ORGANISM="Pseudo-nitzschia arenysensis, Strain B593" /LENGTH=155 /DNA_ID=CAMNT_0003628659 /DNA_START=152 /DNA_END=619 /DNA_ORIENTATION=-
MNSPQYSSKTMTTLTRLRQQHEPTTAVTPIHSADESDDSSTIQNNFNKMTSEQSANASADHNEQTVDLYTPLSYDEADEDQLVDFFTTIDIDSFGECENVINNLSEIPLETTRQTTKRRRLSNSGDSCSTAFSEDTYGYDGTEMQRKQNRDAPVE